MSMMMVEGEPRFHIEWQYIYISGIWQEAVALCYEYRRRGRRLEQKEFIVNNAPSAVPGAGWVNMRRRERRREHMD